MSEQNPTAPSADAAATDPAAVDPATAPDAPAAAPSGVTKESGFVSARPLLMVGAAGDEVAELGYLLAGHGFPNAISEGQAAAPPILDDALMRVVVEFQAAKGIDPKIAEPGGGPVVSTNVVSIGVVDARTWEALLGYQHKVTPVGMPVS